MQADANPSESRTAHRFVSRVEVMLAVGTTEVGAVITDISSAGARVETSLSVKPGMIAKIHYLMPGRRDGNRLIGEVVRLLESGFAMRFLADEHQ